MAGLEQLIAIWSPISSAAPRPRICSTRSTWAATRLKCRERRKRVCDGSTSSSESSEMTAPGRPPAEADAFDESMMETALGAGREAADLGEVPVGS